MIFSQWDKMYTIIQDVKFVLHKKGIESSVIIGENDNKYTTTVKVICNLIILLINDKSIWEKKND